MGKTKEKTNKAKKETKTDTLPDGTVLDIDSFDWGEFNDLKRRQKLFIIWYTMPNQSGFMHFSKAAKKAGYTTNTASTIQSKWKANDRLQQCLKMFEDKVLKTSVADAYKSAVQMKIKRATYNIKDYYETIEIKHPETGETFNRIVAKDINEIEEDKAAIIDNVDINQSGIATLKLPNREKELNDIIKLNAELNQDKSTGDYDVETTVEAVRNNLNEIRTTVRVSNAKIRENAENYIENDENQPEFD